MPNNSRENKKGEERKFHLEFAKQLATLSTAGFGLAAALAWNSLIQEILNKYIRGFLGGGLILSRLIYAIIVTLLAVFITLQLSRLIRRLEK
ncbi:MAG: hypothetical protein A3A51_00730 [Candidatus Levybacteria bacterium RIFCSPLOWO2_01_FULL_39_10]|nr:MAG: hypothetical protein A3A51_00730 [Candidatus Levybacteria bacterium RIFCSPLOWO2_01_FULL_39_10]